MIFREIIRQLVLIERPISNKLHKVVGSFDLTLSQLKAMDFIEKSDTCTLVGISRYLSIKNPSVTRMIITTAIK